MENSNIFSNLSNMISFGSYVVDIETYEILHLNDFFKKELGSPDNKKCYEFIFGVNAPCYFCKNSELIKSIQEGKDAHIVFEQFNERQDTYQRIEEKAIRLPDGRLVKYTVAIDISKEKEAQNSLAKAHARLVLQSKELEEKNVLLQKMYDEAKQVAEKDYLTDLYNRRYFYQVGQNMVDITLRQGLTTFVILVDIDHFKNINDQYGHLAGDLVLKQLGQLFNKRVRQSDLIARIGGEEFGYILLDIEVEQACELLETLRKDVEANEFLTENGELIKCTVSIGATEVKYEKLENCIDLADQLMYKAKQQGRNLLIIEHD